MFMPVARPMAARPLRSGRPTRDSGCPHTRAAGKQRPAGMCSPSSDSRFPVRRSELKEIPTVTSDWQRHIPGASPHLDLSVQMFLDQPCDLAPNVFALCLSYSAQWLLIDQTELFERRIHRRNRTDQDTENPHLISLCRL